MVNLSRLYGGGRGPVSTTPPLSSTHMNYIAGGTGVPSPGGGVPTPQVQPDNPFLYSRGPRPQNGPQRATYAPSPLGNGSPGQATIPYNYAQAQAASPGDWWSSSGSQYSSPTYQPYSGTAANLGSGNWAGMNDSQLIQNYAQMGSNDPNRQALGNALVAKYGSMDNFNRMIQQYSAGGTGYNPADMQTAYSAYNSGGTNSTTPPATTPPPQNTTTGTTPPPTNQPTNRVVGNNPVTTGLGNVYNNTATTQSQPQNNDYTGGLSVNQSTNYGGSFNSGYNNGSGYLGRAYSQPYSWTGFRG